MEIEAKYREARYSFVKVGGRAFKQSWTDTTHHPQKEWNSKAPNWCNNYRYIRRLILFIASPPPFQSAFLGVVVFFLSMKQRKKCKLLSWLAMSNTVTHTQIGPNSPSSSQWTVQWNTRSPIIKNWPPYCLTSLSTVAVMCQGRRLNLEPQHSRLINRKCHF